MSKRAEERALEAYPDYPTMDGGYVTQRKTRKVFKQGYETAEKDLALTWQDIKRIVKIADDLIPCTPFVSVSEQIFADEFQTEEAYYKEILKRFKEEKK